MVTMRARGQEGADGGLTPGGGLCFARGRAALDSVGRVAAARASAELPVRVPIVWSTKNPHPISSGPCVCPTGGMSPGWGAGKGVGRGGWSLGAACGDVRALASTTEGDEMPSVYGRWMVRAVRAGGQWRAKSGLAKSRVALQASRECGASERTGNTPAYAVAPRERIACLKYGARPDRLTLVFIYILCVFQVSARPCSMPRHGIR